MNTECSVRATLLRLAGVFIAGAVLWSATMMATAQPFAHVQDTPGGPVYLKGQLLVEFDAGASDAALQDAVRTASLQPVRGIWTAAMKRRGHNEISVVDTPLAVPAAIALLRQHPAVRSVQPNWVYQHCETSNDPYYTGGSLWGMYGDATSPENKFGSQAGEAWATGAIGSRQVYVGVIDEGIMITHTDLAANIWTNPYDPKDGADNDGNGYIDDINGWDFYSDDSSVYDGSADDHGTHVAGTIGAVGGNGTGVAGVNWQVTIISAKFLGPAGGSTSDAIEAIDYFVDLKTEHNLNVVALNNSWGGGGYDPALLDAIGRAAEVGILFVAAAGNASVNNDQTPFYPASYVHDGVVSVAAIDSAGQLASFSNYGATSVDLGAPGAGIYSTVPNRQSRATYASMSGTSMATPHVTGAIALYASVHPKATAAQIKEALLATATATASLYGKTVTGGRLNVAEMLDWAPTPPTVPPTVTISWPENGDCFLSGTLINFLGSASDAQGNDLTESLVWTADGQPIPGGTDGSFDASLSDGIHTITATVTDVSGATGSASITIGVGLSNDSPVVAIASPTDSAPFTDGKSILFSGTAFRCQDGDLTASLVWTAQIGQGEPWQIGTGGSFEAFLCEGTYTITASATDSSGVEHFEIVSVSVDNSSAIVVPPDFDCTDVPSGWSGTLSGELRLQEVYSKSHFGVSPVAITGMAFRVNLNNSAASVPGVDDLYAQGAGSTNRTPAEAMAPPNEASNIQPSADLGSAQIRVVLSTTAASPDNMSATFSQNLGSDATLMFDGTIPIVAATDGSPNGFDIVIPFTISSSFPYDPAKGNLLVDITTFSPSLAHVDASPLTTDGASRAFALDSNATIASSRDTGADVIRFELGPAPPTASFTYTANALTVAFTDRSTDSDGSIKSWAWTFGDNTTSTDPSPTHTYAEGGTYTVSLTVTDDEGENDTTTEDVTVSEGSVASLHCGGLVGTTSTLRNTWRAIVTVTVHDANNQAVSGAAVQGTWSGGYSGPASGTTGEYGTVTLTTEWISNKSASATFTITGISKEGYTYDSSANTATTITVYKP